MRNAAAGMAPDEPSASTGTVILVVAGMVGVIALVAGLLLWGNSGANSAMAVPSTPPPAVVHHYAKTIHETNLGETPDQAIYSIVGVAWLGYGCTVDMLDATTAPLAVRVRVTDCTSQVVAGPYDPLVGARPMKTESYNGFIGWVARSALDLKP